MSTAARGLVWCVVVGVVAHGPVAAAGNRSPGAPRGGRDGALLAGSLIPGLGHVLAGDTCTGLAVLGGVTGLIGGAIALDDSSLVRPAGPASLLAQGGSALWLWSIWDLYQDTRLGADEPRQGALDLMTAPFRPTNLLGPRVLAPMALVGVLAGLGVGLTADGLFTRDTVEVLGRDMDPWSGLAVNGAAFSVISLEAAVGEEAAFRGVVLRTLMEGGGSPWLAIATQGALFGLLHAPNAFPQEGEVDPLAVIETVAVTGALGTYFGYVTWQEGGDLAEAVALHFWYDVVVLTSSYVVAPEEAPFRLGFGFTF